MERLLAVPALQRARRAECVFEPVHAAERLALRGVRAEDRAGLLRGVHHEPRPGRRGPGDRHSARKNAQQGRGQAAVPGAQQPVGVGDLENLN